MYLLRIPERLLQFEGQTKAKLGTPEARSAVDNVIAEKLTFYFNENGAIATQLIKKAIKAAQVREAARKAREDARTGKTKKEKRNQFIWKINTCTN